MADAMRTRRLVQRDVLSGRAALRALEDTALVNACLAGDGRAFEELVARYQVRLLNFVYRTIGDRDRAEDLVQEVFIRVYRHLGRFDQGKKFSTWIYTIASNLAKNELRNRSRSPLVLFQAISSKFEDEDRPLQFEDEGSRPDDLFRKRHLREMVEGNGGNPVRVLRQGESTVNAGKEPSKNRRIPRNGRSHGAPPAVQFATWPTQRAWYSSSRTIRACARPSSA